MTPEKKVKKGKAFCGVEGNGCGKVAVRILKRRGLFYGYACADHLAYARSMGYEVVNPPRAKP